MSDNARYAIYAAPPAGSALAAFGASWLGYDAETGEAQTPPRIEGLTPERWDALTRRARHYGFHGTFKAPFALAEGTNAEGLIEAVTALAAGYAPFDVPLRLARIGGFLAMTPAEELSALADLANRCVEQLDRFRRPETPEQVAQRRAGLTARQSAHLDRWGYPYVFEDYRFHMTLTDPLAGAESAQLQSALASLLEPLLARPLPIDALCLFRQIDRAAPFRLIRRAPLGLSP